MDHISSIFKKNIIKVFILLIYIILVEIISLHVVIPYVWTCIDSHFSFIVR
jgi:hypothetical protein